ncbi:MAG: PQQ-binding-like beta-propeller repeat protein [Chloroflexi bacterium]|nr:PQQ-binding-like beta-propeller repeat protein [Chloroflexota bacterium]
MGSVYRARDMHFPNVPRLVAVKEMINTSPDPLVRQTIVQNFEREANILATLNHPSIPKIYDYFSFENRSYLILEYIHGKDLEAIINETPGFLPEEQVLHWAIQLCDVLAYLHNHKPDPIIFRDMKPSNIMINLSGDVVLVDFGIARTFQVGQKGTMIGTEGYSPPEQYRGEATPLADIYALGATLHHALTRRDPRLEPPFSFSERPIRKINPSVSPELEAVINTALEYEPSKRYQSAEAMKEALLNVARKTGALSRLPTAATISSSAIKPLWTFKCEDEIRASPILYQGKVFIGSYDYNLYALDAINGSFVWKYPTEGGVVTRPAVYENEIFFGSEDGNLYVLNVRTGKLLWTYSTNGPVRSSPRIAEELVVFGSDDHRLYVLSIPHSRALWTFSAADAIRSTPLIAQERIYVGCESGDFYCLDLRGELKWRQQARRAITASPILVGQALYFPSLDGILYAMEARTGWMLWRFRMAKGSITTPANAENLIFVGSADGHLYAVDIRTGREAWRFRTEHQVSGSPTVYKDAVYFGSADGMFYCLDARNGRLRWQFQTGGPITSAPLIYDDIVYIGSADHILYALLA